MNISDVRKVITEGKTVLGIELGSTRIKGVLLDDKNEMLASGGHTWENRLEDGVWTYHLEDVWTGLQACFADLKKNVKETYDVELQTIGAMGISAMMHGYLVFDENDKLLAPFRTCRNTMTEPATIELMELLHHQILAFYHNQVHQKNQIYF